MCHFGGRRSGFRAGTSVICVPFVTGSHVTGGKAEVRQSTKVQQLIPDKPPEPHDVISLLYWSGLERASIRGRKTATSKEMRGWMISKAREEKEV